MEFSRQEYLDCQLFPSPGELLHPGVKPGSLALQADSLLSDPRGEACDKRDLESIPGLFIIVSWGIGVG